jgi:hypothetical protein
MNSYYKWKENGSHIPMPTSAKADIIKAYQDKYKTGCFVETGTLYGDTVLLVKNHFDFVFTVELSQEFALKAAERFKDDENVKVVWGDSGTFLKKLLEDEPTILINRKSDEIEKIIINTPIFFWIDAHFSTTTGVKTGPGLTPIRTELSAIANHSMKDHHVILIDDIRDFEKGRGDYPTIKELNDFFEQNFTNHNILIEDDIMRSTPKG